MQSKGNLKTEWRKRNRGLVMSRSRNHKDIANGNRQMTSLLEGVADIDA